MYTCPHEEAHVERMREAKADQRWLIESGEAEATRGLPTRGAGATFGAPPKGQLMSLDVDIFDAMMARAFSEASRHGRESLRAAVSGCVIECRLEAQHRGLTPWLVPVGRRVSGCRETDTVPRTWRLSDEA